jgi:hypothetical protein
MVILVQKCSSYRVGKYVMAISGASLRPINTQISAPNSFQVEKKFGDFTNPVLVAGMEKAAIRALPTVRATGLEGGVLGNNSIPKNTINYAPKFNTKPIGNTLSNDELRTEIKDGNFNSGFIQTLEDWLSSAKVHAAPNDLRELALSHIYQSKQTKLEQNISTQGKRAKSRDRGAQREVKTANGSPTPPPRKPKKKEKETKAKEPSTLSSNNAQKPPQMDQTPHPMGDWRLDSKGVKVYVGSEVTVAPQRPTTMPNSVRLNNPEPPTKWEIVNGIKRPVEPHTAQQQRVKPQSEPQNLVEREFWKIVESVKTLVR